MRKLIYLCLILIPLFGCDKSPAQQESKNSNKELEQLMKNWSDENISLISIKYKVDVKVLNEIINKYEKMTTGIEGICKLGKDKESDTIKIISVQEAIKELSQKYKIQEKILASILIDKKSMGNREGEE